MTSEQLLETLNGNRQGGTGQLRLTCGLPLPHLYFSSYKQTLSTICWILNMKDKVPKILIHPFILTCLLNNFLINFALSIFVLLKLFSEIITPTVTEMGLMLTVSPFICYFPFLSSLFLVTFWLDRLCYYCFFKMSSWMLYSVRSKLSFIHSKYLEKHTSLSLTFTPRTLVTPPLLTDSLDIVVGNSDAALYSLQYTTCLCFWFFLPECPYTLCLYLMSTNLSRMYLKHCGAFHVFWIYRLKSNLFQEKKNSYI